MPVLHNDSPLTEREKALIDMTIQGMREEFAAMLERMASDPRAAMQTTIREALGTAAKIARTLNIQDGVGGRA